MNCRLKGDGNSSKNKAHIIKAGVCIKKQVDKSLKEKWRDASALLISAIVAKVTWTAHLAILHSINNNLKNLE